MRMKIFLKKLQMYGENADKPIHYIGTNPNNLTIAQGFIPDNDWIDFTADTEDLDKLNLSYRLKENVAEGKSTSNIDKGSSDEIRFVNKAYLFIKEWMNNSVSAPLNGIEVKIQLDNGMISGYIIKNDGLTYCDDDTCVIDVMLKQKDDQYTCIQTTMITDNHSGMFSGTYQHPRMGYCNEFRPTWMLTLIWTIMTLQYVCNLMILPVIVVILAVFYAVLTIIAFISKKLREQKRKIGQMISNMMPDKFTNNYVDKMVKSLGCGREHPAPLLRDYIQNVCSKCGVRVGADSIPLFFDPASKYYNAVMMSADVKKGLNEDNNTTYWIADNGPIQTLDMFLNDLKPVFNAKWFIKNSTLYFNRKDFDHNPDYLYDFIGKDKGLIIDGICYTWNETKKRAYARCSWGIDAFDSMTSDTKSRFNDIVEFNDPVNPLLEGEENKMITAFAMARFRQDGIFKDYLAESLKYLWIVAVTTFGLGQILINSLKNKIDNYLGVIIMQNDTLSLPKLLIWDGVSRRFGRVKYEFEFNRNMPPINPVYNKESKSYTEIHSEDEPYDDYYNINNKLYNWDFSFDAQFKENLFERFHQIDDPRVNPPMNKNFELKIALCLPELERLGVLDEANNIAVGRKVKLNAGEFYKEGVIEEIELSFDGADKMGRWIKLKGRV